MNYLCAWLVKRALDPASWTGTWHQSAAGNFQGSRSRNIRGRACHVSDRSGGYDLWCDCRVVESCGGSGGVDVALLDRIPVLKHGSMFAVIQPTQRNQYLRVEKVGYQAHPLRQPPPSLVSNSNSEAKSA